MPAEADKATLSEEEDDCSGTMCSSSASTPAPGKANNFCKSERADGPGCTVTGTCGAGGREDSPLIAQESGRRRSPCATNPSRQTSKQSYGTMAEDKCCGEVSGDTIVEDKPDSGSPSGPDYRNGERSRDAGRCCDGKHIL